jgi:hypothetical protein
MPLYITGDKGSVTFTSGESMLSPILGHGRPRSAATSSRLPRSRYKIDRVTLGRNSIRGSFVGFFDGATTPPIPANGTNAATLRSDRQHEQVLRVSGPHLYRLVLERTASRAAQSNSSMAL